jgi:hypothetical protein
MPEYLAPGVFIEETSFRAKTIEGVGTTTTGFIGPCAWGPVTQAPDILTGIAEYENYYDPGRGNPLQFSAGAITNFMWHGARAFFDEGGKRLYISRVFRRIDDSAAARRPYVPPPATLAEEVAATYTGVALTGANFNDGHARVTLLLAADAPLTGGLRIRARFPGTAGNLRLRFSFRFGQNLLSRVNGQPAVASLTHGDVVLIDTAPASAIGELYTATWLDVERSWRFVPLAGGANVELATLDPDNANAANRNQVRVLTLDLSAAPIDGSRPPEVWSGLAANPAHTRLGVPDSLFAKFQPLPANSPQARDLPIDLLPGSALDTAAELITLLQTVDAARAGAPAAADQTALNSLSLGLRNPEASDPATGAAARLAMEVVLAGGNDGQAVTSAEYVGAAPADDNYKTGLMAFEDLEDISIVAAPGSTFNFTANANDAQATLNALISHCQRMRYRVAVLDSGNGQSVAEVRAMRARFDSTHAALYFPWVMVRDPITRQDMALPPSGFVAGIYARNDVERGVYKAPANEVVRGALGFELMLNKGQQEVLNPEGVNCFRYFEGRGMRLWGARTISSDPEWKYVNVRRYFAYLEHSIDKGTQWAVFEPNGERLWANVRRTIEDFLLNEWQSGALLGERPEKAYFVRCDRSTMTQNDLDNGRLICLIGVAPLKPAEFVIFRIGQWTADAKR